MNITSICRARDARVRLELQKWFPQLPEFVDYLEQRIFACHGSVLVAQMFGEELSRLVTSTTRIDHEAIRRLGVDGEEMSLLGLTESLSKRNQAFCVATEIFLRQLSAKAQFFEKGTNRQNEPLFEEVRLINPETNDDLMRLFTCALAMIMKTPHDPHADTCAA